MECSCECLQKWVKWEFWFERCFGSNFIWFWSSFSVWKRWVNSGNQIWVWGIQNWNFGVRNEFFVTANCQYSPRRVSLRARQATWSQRAMFARHGEQSYSLQRALCHRRHVLPTTASRTTRHGEQRGDRGGTLPATASKSLGRRVASVLVFLFCILCPFYIFLLWINSWHKHESF